MGTVGIKDLKLRLGRYVDSAARGETITITDRGTPVAILAPLSANRMAVETLKRSGRIRGKGAKPTGVPAKLTGKTPRDPDLSGAVIEGRNR